MIYLDANATAPLRPEAAAAWHHVATQTWGNPSSVHAVGREARACWQQAESELRSLLGAPQDWRVVVTGGASEALALVIAGLRNGEQRALVAPTGHAAVLENITAWGWQRSDLAVTSVGVLDCSQPPAVAELMVLEAANGETGAVQDLGAVMAWARAADPQMRIIVDACQVAGRWVLPASIWQADAVVLSPHKAGGPKGVGVLLVAPGTPVSALVAGGGQQHGWRGGTEDLPSLVASIAGLRAGLDAWQTASERIRSGLAVAWDEISRHHPSVQRLVPSTSSLPNTLAMLVPGVRASQVVTALDMAGVAVSQGAACGSAHDRVNPAALAMGYPPELATGLVRLSALPETTDAELLTATQAIITALDRLTRRSL